LATRSLAECEKEAVQDVTEQELLKANNMLQNIEKLQADLQTAKTNLKTTESQLAASQRSLASDATEQQRLKDIVETNCPSQDEYDGAKAALQAHTAVYETYTTAKVTLGVRQESLVTAKKALADLEAALIRQERQHNVLSTLYRAAQVFHWNELPKKVAQANLRAIVRDVNENLVLFESPFTVEADDSLTFIVNFPGRAPVEAVQLSGGQKVVLAVAFRTALGRVFGNDVGMMFMDEPTAGLDADNIGYFHEALQRFASKMATKSQLVVVTHVDGLGHAADQRIEFRR
jgi:exonuclease SbcC